jgi:hypothetical protein
MSAAASVMEANTHSTHATATSDYSRVRMKIMTNSDIIAVILQNIYKPCALLRQGSVVPSCRPTTGTRTLRTSK